MDNTDAHLIQFDEIGSEFDVNSTPLKEMSALIFALVPICALLFRHYVAARVSLENLQKFERILKKLNWTLVVQRRNRFS